mmetsp:Transcript_123790/g.194172  ORF Transcript_123790/g.194172 Transcript_123790/m.194172 type:complete len:180 (-) Transcript_123790:107-646(-)
MGCSSSHTAFRQSSSAYVDAEVICNRAPARRPVSPRKRRHQRCASEDACQIRNMIRPPKAPRQSLDGLLDRRVSHRSGESYKSMLHSPGELPNGISAQPDKDSTSIYVEQLEKFMSLIEANSNKFERAIFRARGEKLGTRRRSGIYHSPSMQPDKIRACSSEPVHFSGDDVIHRRCFTL